MEIRGIDVSAWQGAIDWDTVANYGMDFAILRITEAGNVIDSCFEKNYSGCQKHNIPTGAYKYSYAMTVAEIQSEARKVVKVLNGRKLQYPVWLDLEWNNQRSLGAEQIHKLAEAFEKIITAAGYKFGIYCNVDWYLNVICSHLKKYDFWIARYPASDNGTLQERLRPDFGVGWQYSSKAKIPGISGTVDRNIFYKDYNEAKDIKPSYQGQPWCAAFISWCFMKAFGLDNAKKLLKHWPYVYCPTLGVLFVKNANPKVGDIVIFKHGDTFTHTGFVTKVAGDRFWTIEGNTSGASGIVANGGGVCQKSYYNSNLPGTKFCTPDYSIVLSADKDETDKTTNPEGGSYMFNPETVKAGDKNTSVLLLQEILRARGFKGKNGKALKLTWTADANTIYALKAYQESRKEVLEVDGICGSTTWKDLIAI